MFLDDHLVKRTC